MSWRGCGGNRREGFFGEGERVLIVALVGIDAPVSLRVEWIEEMIFRIVLRNGMACAFWRVHVGPRLSPVGLSARRRF